MWFFVEGAVLLFLQTAIRSGILALGIHQGAEAVGEVLERSGHQTSALSG